MYIYAQPPVRPPHCFTRIHSPHSKHCAENSPPFNACRTARATAFSTSLFNSQKFAPLKTMQQLQQLRRLQDGSCNGLQHYAALAHDHAGGAAVNLLPGPRPADVYAAVAGVVDARVHQDAEVWLCVCVCVCVRARSCPFFVCALCMHACGHVCARGRRTRAPGRGSEIHTCARTRTRTHRLARALT